MTAEQMIVGRMMASRHQLAEAIAFIENKPGFFVDPAHQRLYEAMCVMFGKYQEVDVTTVLVQLKKHKGFEKGDIDKCHAAEEAAMRTSTILDGNPPPRWGAPGEDQVDCKAPSTSVGLPTFVRPPDF